MSTAAHPPAAPVTRVPAPGAPVGASDATRRWALDFPDGRRRFAGVTPPEGDAAAAILARAEAEEWDRALVEIALPVILSDGAGPYLLDAEGRVTLALGAHPGRAGERVAMGEVSPDHRIGLVRVVEGGLWRWVVVATVTPAERVRALGALDAARDEDDLARWGAEFGGGEGA